LDERTRVGANVRAARLRRGMSLDVAAGLAGHTKSWLSKVERALLPLERRSDIAALADALGVSPVDLTGQPFALPNDAPGAAARDAIPALRRALLDRPPGGRRPLEELHAGVARLAELQHSGRAGDAGNAAAGMLEGLRASAGGRDHTEVSRLTVLAGYYTHSVLQAIGQYDLALVVVAGLMDRAAAEADDPVTTALVAVTKSYGLAQVPVGAYAAAVDVASLAADDIAAAGGVEAAAAQGHLQLAAGFAAAALGDREAATDRLHTAGQHARRVDGPTMFGAHLGFGMVNVRLHEVAVGVELGQPAVAVQASQGLDVEHAPNLERAACWLADLGRAYAALHRDAEAVRALRRAESIAPLRTRLHPLVREAVAGINDRPQPKTVGREARGLAYRMGLPH
jgi:transcriptional regulator with XRE-family HTH domain